MLFENLKSEQFNNKVKQISNNLGISPDWLMAIMYFESGLNHKSVNKISNATGLIQFMPDTAKGLGTTVDDLKNMSEIQQLDFVNKYLNPYKKHFNSYIDVYLAVFFPAAIGKKDNYILQTSKLSKETIARQNPIFDTNKDSMITVGELKVAMANLLKKKAPAEYAKDIMLSLIPGNYEQKKKIILIMIIIILSIVVLLLKILKK